MKQLLLATRNEKKVEELRRLLKGMEALKVVAASDFGRISEPQETGLTFLDNARLKAHYYAHKTGLPSVADDSGLVVDALDGRPGVLSARFGRDDEERIRKILEETRLIPPERKSARFVCAMVFADPVAEIGAAEGILEGFIAAEPRGSFGFGYDPIFVLPEKGKHLAEIPPEEKNEISHRGTALRKIIPIIENYFRTP